MGFEASAEAFKAKNSGDADQVFADIHDTADVVRSLAISLRESAFRRDRIDLRIHRPEFIREARLLAGLIGDLAPLEGEVAEAKRK
jgi:hypothetical protein